MFLGTGGTVEWSTLKRCKSKMNTTECEEEGRGRVEHGEVDAVDMDSG